MGLLLRERIVFLGSSIDDFVADAVMSQLLLLDAQDPTKDIKLFINSTGGSLRLDEVLIVGFFLFFRMVMQMYSNVSGLGVDVQRVGTKPLFFFFYLFFI